MKLLKIAFLLAFLSTSFRSFANKNISYFIDNTDSIIISTELIVLTGGQKIIEIPLFIKSDESIYSLDLGLKIDTTKLRFVSATDNSNTLQFVDGFNQSESIYRFTSSTLRPLVLNGNRIITLKFRLEDKVNSFYKKYLTILSSNSLLNGDMCGTAFKGSDVLNTPTIDIQDSPIKIYPNHSSDYVTMTAPFDGNYKIVNVSGQTVRESTTFENESLVNISISDLFTGMYFLQIADRRNSKIFTEKIFRL